MVSLPLHTPCLRLLASLLDVSPPYGSLASDDCCPWSHGFSSASSCSSCYLFRPGHLGGVPILGWQVFSRLVRLLCLATPCHWTRVCVLLVLLLGVLGFPPLGGFQWCSWLQCLPTVPACRRGCCTFMHTPLPAVTLGCCLRHPEVALLSPVSLCPWLGCVVCVQGLVRESCLECPVCSFASWGAASQSTLPLG